MYKILTFNLPNTNERYLKGNDRKYGTESLPNIKGKTTEQYSSLSDTSEGTFYKISQVQAYGLSGSGGTNWRKYGFDASRISSTYQDRAKVNPDHMYIYFIVKY